MERELQVNSQIKVSLSEIRFSFVRSSGPGGQNVNKVNTKAVLRWPVAGSEALPDDVRQRFMANYRRRISSTGDFILTSQRYRDQQRNVDDCLNKLRAMIGAVAIAPNKRKPTRVSRAVKQRRLEQKRQAAQKKQRRRERPSLDD